MKLVEFPLRELRRVATFVAAIHAGAVTSRPIPQYFGIDVLRQLFEERLKNDPLTDADLKELASFGF